jgi:hypothetical protein
MELLIRMKELCANGLSHGSGDEEADHNAISTQSESEKNVPNSMEQS